MQVYECVVDGYADMKKGEYAFIRGKIAEDKDGNKLPINVDYLLSTPEHFVLKPEMSTKESKVAQPELPVAKMTSPLPGATAPEDIVGYAVIRKIGKLHKTIDDARKAAEKKGDGVAYVVRVVGKVNVVHKVEYQPVKE